MKVKCRFAPSPTGHLHIGGARTALFNWLFARHQGGEFTLRIEDTDVERSQDEYAEAILAGLKWLGIDWDGEPVFQSQRLDLYRREAQRLVDEGKAYHCSCTPEELEAMREKAMAEGKKPKYDGRCRNRAGHPAGRPQVIRFKCPQDGATVIEDLIQGRISFENSELDDLVIVRGDGSPTYNFCAVIDDHDLQMTHVIRGSDHINNTPRQIQLYQALGYDLPAFAHHPLILGQDKSKLSKRHGATSLIAYEDLGYLPEAMMNFLARLGWSHGDEEIFSRDDLIRLFEIKDVGKSPGVWDPDKLLWLNGHYLRQKPMAGLAPLALPFFEKKGLPAQADAKLERILELHRERIKTLAELPGLAAYYYQDQVEFDEAAAKKFLTPETAGLLAKIKAAVEALAEFDEKSIEGAFTALMESTGLKLGKLAQPVRVALTGGTVSPGIFEVMAVMGRDMVLQKLERARAAAAGG